MWCCAPFCGNTLDNSTSVEKDKDKRITFYVFPPDVYLRGEWIKALGIQDTALPDSAVVCSQHFQTDDFCETECGLKQIVNGAIPSTVQVCMLCLDTDSKMYLVRKHKLEESLEKLTGHPLCDTGNLKQTVCVQCAQRLINYSQFREKSLRARSLMMEVVERQNMISEQQIEMINRTKHKLKCNFVTKTLGPDHCDLYIMDKSDKGREEEIAVEVETVVKEEECYESMSVEVDVMTVKLEVESQPDNSSNDFVVYPEEGSISHDTQISETNQLDDKLHKNIKIEPGACNTEVAEQVELTWDPLKCKIETFQCEICYEEFYQELEYIGHMRMHQQNGDVVGGCERSPFEDPCAADSWNWGSAHSTGNNLSVQKWDDVSHHSAHLPQTAVTPYNKRHALYNEINLTPSEEADTNKGSIEIFETSDNSDRQLSIFNKTNRNTNRITTNAVKLYGVIEEHKKSAKPFSTFDNLYMASSSKESYCNPASDYTVSATGNKRNIKKRKNVTDGSINNIDIQMNNSSQESLCMQYTEENSFISDVCENTSLIVNNMNTTHTEVKQPFICKFCQLKCKFKSNLIIHLRTHTGEKPYSCEICDYKCSLKSHLSSHMITHTGQKPYSCEICNYKCALKNHLAVHMRTHTGEKPYSCNFCSYSSARSCHLALHIKTHTGENPFSCNLCSYKCKSKCTLVRHIRTHTGEKPYSCDMCNYKCARKSRLVIHKKTHTVVKPFSCEVCGYKCTMNDQLIRHIAQSHNGDKPYSCELCDYKCARKGNLASHVKTHTGERRYSCDTCNYKCSQKSTLVQHARTHTGENPYSCEKCDYKCAVKGDLVLHTRTHTYSCEICNYKCKTSSRLVNHKRTHAAKAL